MKRSEIRLIQKYLSQVDLYHAEIDGKKGPKTDRAIEAALWQRAGDLPEGWTSWPKKRKAVAYLQILCHDRDIEVGEIDGLYGPQTESASEILRELESTGTIRRGFGDIIPVVANPHGFPLETYETLCDHYGKPCKVRRVNVPCPWPLRLDWDLSTTTNSISIHENLAESLEQILKQVFETFGSERIKQFGLDRYGGSYNCRKKRGSRNAWSTHSWGIAIDWYPSRNKLKWRSDRASLAGPELDPWWEIWEKEGWVSLGRTEDRDWMHVQAAKRHS